MCAYAMSGASKECFDDWSRLLAILHIPPSTLDILTYRHSVVMLS